MEIEAYIQGLMPLPPLQCDMVAQAVNERLDELVGGARVPYVRTARAPQPRTGALAALVELLDGSRLATLEVLPSLAAAAAAAIGVQVAIYLVDYGQQWLEPLPPSGAAPGEPLAVEGTAAGQAYTSGEVVVEARGSGDIRWWMPLRDGVQRLGVLDVIVPVSANAAVQEPVRWLSALLGGLLVSTATRGDGLACLRPPPARTPAAELISELLPPLSCATDSVQIAALLDPGDDGGGDAFDFTVSESGLSFAVFGAAGRTPANDLITVAALAAYRQARRAGRDLRDQARAIDDSVSSRGGGAATVSGMLSELDLTTGRLSYVAAGDPHPVLLRDGKVTKTLPGQRGPLGRGGADVPPGEEILQPRDWLVVPTDGVLDGGPPATEDWFVSLLEREVTDAHAPPETVRRLLREAHALRQGDRADDATIVTVRWTGPPDVPTSGPASVGQPPKV